MEIIPGSSRTRFRDKPETVRLQPGISVHHHPGNLFGFILEQRSESSRNRVHLRPDSSEATQEPLTGTIEADETYVGGRYDSRRKRAKYDKEPVFGVVQRNGKARTYHMPQPTMRKIMTKIKGDVSIEADGIYTDDGKYYGTTAGALKNHNHQRVNHIAREWVRGDVHTGTIDGYWSLLKRGIIGSFHQVSIKHLQRYLSEFQFRWNNREAQDMFPMVIIALLMGIAMPYDELIGKKVTASSEVSPDSSEEPF